MEANMFTLPEVFPQIYCFKSLLIKYIYIYNIYIYILLIAFIFDGFKTHDSSVSCVGLLLHCAQATSRAFLVLIELITIIRIIIWNYNANNIKLFLNNTWSARRILEYGRHSYGGAYSVQDTCKLDYHVS